MASPQQAARQRAILGGLVKDRASLAVSTLLLVALLQAFRYVSVFLMERKGIYKYLYSTT